MRPEDAIGTKTVIEVIKSLPQTVKAFFAEKAHNMASNTATSNEDYQNLHDKEMIKSVKFTAYLCMYAADGSIVNGWLASQTDMLATDWCILD